MVQKRQFVHDYLGSPDMNMAQIAKGFGVDGEIAESPEQLKRPSPARARRRSRAGPISSMRRWRAWESRGRRSRGSRRSASRGSARRRSRSPRRDAENDDIENAVPHRGHFTER